MKTSLTVLALVLTAALVWACQPEQSEGNHAGLPTVDCANGDFHWYDTTPPHGADGTPIAAMASGETVWCLRCGIEARQIDADAGIRWATDQDPETD